MEDHGYVIAIWTASMPIALPASLLWPCRKNDVKEYPHGEWITREKKCACSRFSLKGRNNYLILL